MMGAAYSPAAGDVAGAGGVRVVETKAPTAFRTISEVATNLEVPQHVLRFWESKFQQVRPLKRGGGRRYYRPEDVDLLSNIKELLYNQGLTIRGVQKLLRETGRGGIVRPSAQAVAAAREADVVALEADDMSAEKATLAPPSVMTIVAQPETALLSMAARREVESLLGELKAMRDLLRQTGV